MKPSTAVGIGLGAAAALGIGALVLRKPRYRSQGTVEGSSPGPIPENESRSIAWKGCVGTITHLGVPDQMGNTYVWSVRRGQPEDTLVASGVTKNARVAELAMWEALRWQICQPPVINVSGVPS